MIIRSNEDKKQIKFIKEQYEAGKKDIEEAKENKAMIDALKENDTEVKEALEDEYEEDNSSEELEKAFEDLTKLDDEMNTNIEEIEDFEKKLEVNNVLGRANAFAKKFNELYEKEKNVETLSDEDNYIMKMSYIGYQRLKDFYEFKDLFEMINKAPLKKLSHSTFKSDYNLLRKSVISKLNNSPTIFYDPAFMEKTLFNILGEEDGKIFMFLFYQYIFVVSLQKNYNGLYISYIIMAIIYLDRDNLNEKDKILNNVKELVRLYKEKKSK